MAIDTAAKRRGVASIAVVYFAPGITPDATPDVFWRQTSGWGYGGIEAGEATVSAVSGSRYYYSYRYGGVSALLLLTIGR